MLTTIDKTTNKEHDDDDLNQLSWEMSQQQPKEENKDEVRKGC